MALLPSHCRLPNPSPSSTLILTPSSLSLATPHYRRQAAQILPARPRFFFIVFSFNSHSLGCSTVPFSPSTCHTPLSCHVCHLLYRRVVLLGLQPEGKCLPGQVNLGGRAGGFGSMSAPTMGSSSWLTLAKFPQEDIVQPCVVGHPASCVPA